MNRKKLILVVALCYMSITALMPAMAKLQKPVVVKSQTKKVKALKDHSVDTASLLPKKNIKRVVIASANAPTPTHDTYLVTAYTAGYESTGKRPGDATYGVTASGTKVQSGVTIACPRELPFGTQIYIPALNNTYICLDRGGAIKGKHIDVYINSLQKAQEFGKKYLDVIIYKEANAS